MVNYVCGKYARPLVVVKNQKRKLDANNSQSDAKHSAVRVALLLLVMCMEIQFLSKLMQIF